MKNPFSNAVVVLRTWMRMRRYPGVFSLSDALMQVGRVVLPTRFHHRFAAAALRSQTRIAREPDGVWRIDLPEHGLVFFWREQPTPNLWYLVEQEFDERNPHCYTTAPIKLTPESLIVDVGACEGLFAFRAAKNAMAKRVICFEPLAEMAELIRRGAEANRVRHLIDVETVAVTQRSGQVSFAATDGADRGCIDENTTGTRQIPAVSIDDYLSSRGIRIRPCDLLKIDAEGADMDVLIGAEQVISEVGPQIAVTTYHKDTHCEQMVDWLRAKQPNYRMRVKGFSFWTGKPRPVLLQAAR